MLKMLRSEWLKLRGVLMWMLIVISPLIGALSGWLSMHQQHEGGQEAWGMLLGMMSALHGMLLFPLLTGVFAALVCRYDHANGGWKQLLALPISRTTVYASKYIVIITLLALVQLLFLSMVLLVGTTLGFGSDIPWKVLLFSVGLGWVASLPLAALQLFVSTAWSSFAAPLALNVIFTIPNILILNSATYGPYYPWAQPAIGMLQTTGVSVYTFSSIIISGFLLFVISGWVYFTRKAV